MSAPRLLVVKLGAIGDVVLSLPALRALRTRHPDAEITLLVGESAAPIVAHEPSIDHVWTIDETIFWRRRLAALLRLIRAIRRRRFAAVFVLHWSRWFHGFFWLAGIGERHGFARAGRSLLLTHRLPYVEAVAGLHDVDQYARLTAEGALAGRAPRLTFAAEESLAFDRRLAELGVDAGRPWIAVAPGGGHNAKLTMPSKRWPIERFAALLASLEQGAARGGRIVLLGDASERPLAARLSGPGRIDLAGRLTLRETAQVIARSALFVGNDSSLLHVAGAVGTPSVGLFGPTSPAGKTPEWAPHVTLHAGLPCSPCYRHGHVPPCAYERRCLSQITAEAVAEACARLLRAREAKERAGG